MSAVAGNGSTPAGTPPGTRRRALVVGAAGGSIDRVAEVLARFGFGPPETVASLAQVGERLRAAHYELLVVPVAGQTLADFALLEREIRLTPGTVVIGTAPEANSELILRALRAGVHEFLVSPPDPVELATAVDRLMRRHQSEVHRGAVFAVYSAKGGLGVSTIAANLADALARGNPDRRVALADLVVSNGDSRVLLDLKPSYDLSSLVGKLDRIDADLLYSLLTPSGTGLWVLPAPEDPESDETLDGSTTAAIIDHLRSHFAFTVLDCEHHVSERTLAALDAADRILLITQLTVPALRATQRSLALCQRLGYPHEKVLVLVNRLQSGDVLTAADAASLLKHELYWKLPNDYRATAAALAKGVPVHDVDASSKLACSYGQLSAKLGGARVLRRNGTSPEGSSRLRRLFGLGRRS